MNPTEQLRTLPDELGVRWDYGPSGASSTAFWVNGKELSFSNWRDGLICSTIFTPAQAIHATLGDNDSTRAQQLDAIDEILRTLNAEVANDNIEYNLYSELHDMVGELANLIESRAGQIAVMASAGTCHEVIDESVNWHMTICSECGFTLAVEEYGPSNFCPNCGRRVVDE